MKRFFTALFLLVGVIFSTYGENVKKSVTQLLMPGGKHEISVNYGDITHNECLGAFIVIGSLGLAQRDTKYTGEVGVEYLYYPIKRIGVGGAFAYEYGHGRNGENRSHHHYISLMPTVKIYWFNREHVGMYSRVGVGATYVNGKYNGMPDNSWRLAMQLSAISIDFGSSMVRGFLEVGYGTQGFVMGGLRVRF